jgi:general secretion pathway protein G
MYTLVELMLVVIIIGVLVAMVVPRFTGRSEEARKEVARADINANIATALKLYELDNGAFPTTDEGLQALLVTPPSNTHWKGPYLDKLPLDPWGTAYKYVSPSQRKYDYELYSFGRNKVDNNGGDDDITNWADQSPGNQT